MGNEPKVTGLSPMTGPPGTKITVRGENFGLSSDDVIKLTINGSDCLPYLEWKSSTKIVTRCSKTYGKGDIVITTKSGGVGSCDVPFNCYEESVGPTTETAVWIEEVDYRLPEKEKLTILSSNEESSLEFFSNRFKSQLYLSHNYHEADLKELQQLQRTLQSDLANKSDPEVASSSSNRAALLKSNIPVIMECLQILERLSKVITTSKDTSIDNIVKSIRQSLAKTHELFDPLLAQKDLVQSVESAMQVFRQNETLFNLPSAIENSIQSRNYDSVVKEISGVLLRLENVTIDEALTRRIRADVRSKVNELKATIEIQLHQNCKSTNGSRSIEEVKKLISHLNRLGSPINYDVWIALREMSDSLTETLSKSFSNFLKLSSQTATSQENEQPYVVQFVQSALSTFDNTYYDILNLGQSYFDPKDEFACRESEDIKQSKLAQFEKVMISEPISHLSNLLRLALVPESKLGRRAEGEAVWPAIDSGTYVQWLKHVLQSVIKCHIRLTKSSLPYKARSAMEDFKEFVFELRVRSMQILFENATLNIKNIHLKEDWTLEVDDHHGGMTSLPSIFEQNVIETLSFANEVIFKTSLPDEKSILKIVAVQASLKAEAQRLIKSFIVSLDKALVDDKKRSAESACILIASEKSNRAPSNHINRHMVTICNCKYTKDQILPRLQNEFEKLQELKMDKVFKQASSDYCEYINKLSEKFCKIKCDELCKSLKNPKYDYAEELQINLMITNSQIYLIAPPLVNSLMTLVVNEMQKELKKQQIIQRL